jgi:short-subunit dehydrogenase
MVPMSTRDLEGHTALVTGASSGLGAAFARNLAARGARLVLTARREAQLQALAAELEAAHRVTVTVLPLDLSEPGSAEALFARTEGAGIPVDILVNNAGGGIYAYFADIPWERTARQIQLNVTSLVELTWLFVGAMRARGRPGWILNVSSVGAYTPSPAYATYSAGKAFVRDFSEAVAYELRETPIRVCSLCPGLTRTEFHQASGQHVGGALALTYMSAESVAEVGLRALFGGRSNVVAGWSNWLGTQLMRLAPRWFLVWSAAVAMGKPK